MLKLENKPALQKAVYGTTISMAVIGILFITGKQFPNVETTNTISEKTLAVTEDRKETIEQRLNVTSRSSQEVRSEANETKVDDSKKDEKTKNTTTTDKKESSENQGSKTTSTKNDSSKKGKNTTAKTESSKETKNTTAKTEGSKESKNTTVKTEGSKETKTTTKTESSKETKTTSTKKETSKESKNTTAKKESSKETKNTAKTESKKSATKTTSISKVKISKTMDLTKRTGLSRDDFIKLISGVKADTSGFFEDNAGKIYDLCKKYSINEIFFCGLISAESGWNIASNHRRTHNYISLMSGGKLIKYSSVNEGLEVAAQKLHYNYLTPGGKFYHGKTLAGVKTCFCPSSGWVNLVYGRMQQIL